ncbi:uncharacterized protein LOC111717516 isoform X2 [Eurytemora carolleeae]|uniref:uncharacterized protein LOC111717516 isoform X2 n=1 Tax=Eurytemora carolleeae TaxID=1294199 RepID=UPI000C75FBBC|nr:uncharacterized protein LOC111717516 isoform X2 [Eurytemora carolleeae]|eukprot:XP_023348780.1 uncharacterized protein LOC111717516 isoform X2 [Eurytemora affinis]
MYGFNTKAKPVRESTWQAPLLLLLPLLCALLLSLPAPLLHLPHPLSALPGTEICRASPNITYQTSIATLSALLPVTTLIILLLGLSLRRCLSCTGGECISSYCKEEIFLGMMIFPYSLVSIGKNLPLLDIHLERIGKVQSWYIVKETWFREELRGKSKLE